MKPMRFRSPVRLSSFLGCLLGLFLAGALHAAATNSGAPASKMPGASTNAAAIVNPVNLKSDFDPKGRDPFFPNSSRQSSEPSGNGENASTVILTVKGISGFGGHRMAIINDQTFAVGDESEVITAGGRIRIRCVEIRDDTAVITVGRSADRMELRMPKRY